jgi:hypothetical protein
MLDHVAHLQGFHCAPGLEDGKEINPYTEKVTSRNDGVMMVAGGDDFHACLDVSCGSRQSR